MICPFCESEISPSAMVCPSCARDIAVPKSLLAERDDLLRKRDLLQQKLAEADAELKGWERRKKRPSV